MPFITNISTVEFPNKIPQRELKDHVHKMFPIEIPQKFLDVFDNAEIEFRNLCKPISFYTSDQSFKNQNDQYLQICLEFSTKAVQECMKKVNVNPSQVTDIFFVSTTGLATPSMDAMIINKLKLNPNINRSPLWGLGCGGGVSGLSKACTAATANPNAIVLLIAAELCSLTFLRGDNSSSNLIASSLFSDGIAASIIKGDNHKIAEKQPEIKILNSCSKLYYDSLDVMGWDFLDSGFKVVFSKDIPAFINQNVKNDVLDFLSKNNLKLEDIKNFVFHPGGKKVLDAYTEALNLKKDDLKYSREVIKTHGNMSSSTVLYVLEQTIREGFIDGYGLMMAMGPGFSTEMILLSMNKHHTSKTDGK